MVLTKRTIKVGCCLNDFHGLSVAHNHFGESLVPAVELGQELK